MKEIARIYTQLRAKYFLDSEPLRPGSALHIPPPAADIYFTWLPENTDALAMTTWDEDGDAFEMRFNSKFARRAIVRESVLHELTHIRLGTKHSCGGFSHAWGGARVSQSMQWHRETVRLAQAGAIRL
jgi:hypothetical protein